MNIILNCSFCSTATTATATATETATETTIFAPAATAYVGDLSPHAHPFSFGVGAVDRDDPGGGFRGAVIRRAASRQSAVSDGDRLTTQEEAEVHERLLIEEGGDEEGGRDVGDEDEDGGVLDVASFMHKVGSRLRRARSVDIELKSRSMRRVKSLAAIRKKSLVSYILDPRTASNIDPYLSFKP